MAIKLNAAGKTTYLTRDAAANPITADDTTDFSVCGWIYRDTDNGEAGEYVVQLSSGVTADYGVSMRLSTDVPGMFGTGQGDYAFIAATPLATGAWFFFAYTGLSLFTANEYYGTTTTLTAAADAPKSYASPLDAVIVGTYPVGAPVNSWRGRIAHLRIWSGRALTKTEFEAEMVATSVVGTSNLWAAYEFVADNTDSSGNGYHLSITGTDVSYVAGPISDAVVVPAVNPMATRPSTAAMRASFW